MHLHVKYKIVNPISYRNIISLEYFRKILLALEKALYYIIYKTLKIRKT